MVTGGPGACAGENSQVKRDNKRAAGGGPDPSVTEVAHVGEQHAHAVFVGGVDNLLIAHRATGLDDAGDTGGSRGVDTVAEREEGVGGHDGARHGQPFILGLDAGNLGRVDAAHLAGADADGLAVFGVDDGVGFDELGHFPAEQQVVQFGLGGLALADHLQIPERHHAKVALLHQQAAVDALEVKALCRRSPLAALEQPHVLLGGDRVASLLADGGGDDHLDELAFDDGLGGGAIQFTVEGDDAAKGGGGVGLPGALVGAQQVAADGHAARVGVLDDDTGRLVELFDALQRRVGVGDVVVGEGLALQLDGACHRARGGLLFGIEGGGLVAVLAVAHVLLLDELAVEGAREAGLLVTFLVVTVRGNHSAEVVGDHAVVGGGVFEGGNGQIEAGGQFQAVAVAIHLADDAVVVGSLDHDGHIFVVLGGGANHGRAADVDVLDRIGQGAIGLGDGGGEGIEVDHDHVDGGDVVLSHDGVVLLATAENAAVDLGMQGLDPAVHHLGESGVVGDLGHRQTRLGQQLGGTTGGEQGHAALVECLGKFHDASLVRHTQQCTANGSSLFHHTIVLSITGTVPWEARLNTESPQINGSGGFRKPLSPETRRQAKAF